MCPVRFVTYVGPLIQREFPSRGLTFPNLETLRVSTR